MKRMLILFTILFLLSSISAIKITEVESNPAGTDAGYEWVELYSSSEINLSGYKIVNNDEGEILLGGNFSGYYVYTFSSQWLDNTDEKVYLYKNGELIDETTLFADSKNNDMTWQICSGSWEFKSSTKELENGCDTEDDPPEDDEVEDKEEQENTTDESEDEETDNAQEEQTKEDSNSLTKQEEEPLPTIYLNPKDIKSEKNIFKLDKSNFAIFGFIIFCILILFLFVLKRNKFRKNEFN